MYTYGIVSSDDDRQKSAELVMKVYGDSGYINSDHKIKAESSIGKYLNGPSALTFVARDKIDIIGTISIVNDSKSGLPFDVLFKEELAMFRQMGAQISEVCQFAINKEKTNTVAGIANITKGGIAVTAELISFAFHYALHKKTDYLCFTINPKHRLFYESIGCIQIGGEKKYSAVNNNPAIAFVFNMRNLRPESKHPIKSNWLISKILKTPPNYQIFAPDSKARSFGSFFSRQIIDNIFNRF